MYKQPSPGAPPMNEFTGFKLSDLYTIEKIFHINIYVYDLIINDKDNPLSCHLIRRSMCKYPDTLNLNLYKTHFSYNLYTISSCTPVHLNVRNVASFFTDLFI